MIDIDLPKLAKSNHIDSIKPRQKSGVINEKGLANQRPQNYSEDTLTTSPNSSNSSNNYDSGVKSAFSSKRSTLTSLSNPLSDTSSLDTIPNRLNANSETTTTSKIKSRLKRGKNFIAHPLKSLQSKALKARDISPPEITKGGDNIKWTPSSRQNFERLKKIFLSWQWR